jgi:hypothetical protein
MKRPPTTYILLKKRTYTDENETTYPEQQLSQTTVATGLFKDNLNGR